MVYVHLDWFVYEDIDMFTVVYVCHFWVQQLEIFSETQQRCSQAGHTEERAVAARDCAVLVQVHLEIIGT